LLLLAFHQLGSNYCETAAWFLVITGLSSFLAMNFTGSSTYTSLSGVKKEMKVAVPLQMAFVVTGLVLMMIGRMKV
jgi:acetyl-CoA decarbonylase/synthase complex subunit gamma